MTLEIGICHFLKEFPKLLLPSSVWVKKRKPRDVSTAV